MNHEPTLNLPIHTESQCHAALRAIYALLEVAPACGTAEGRRLSELVQRVEQYEVRLASPAGAGASA